MQYVSRKIVRAFGNHPTHWCPGCKQLHPIAVDRPFENGARWSWDGNVDAPTFSPSVNIGPSHCHYFLKAGRIEFLSDCKHALAGQTVDLPDLPDWVLNRAGPEPDEEW